MNTTVYQRATATWQRLRAALPQSDRVRRIYCPHCRQWTRPRHYNPATGSCHPCTHRLAAKARRQLQHLAATRNPAATPQPTR
jgi:uncharacterized paraquat-inducible protein A